MSHLAKSRCNINVNYVTLWFYRTVISPTDADRMANNGGMGMKVWGGWSYEWSGVGVEEGGGRLRFGGCVGGGGRTEVGMPGLGELGWYGVR